MSDVQKFLNELANVLEVEAGSLTMETVLEGTDKWDSLAVVATMAMLDEQFGVVVEARKLTAAKSAADVYALVAAEVPLT